MTYSGAWRNARVRVDKAAPLGAARPSEHMHYDSLPVGSRAPEATPRLAYGPPELSDDGTGYDQLTQRQAPGLRLDRERTDTHDTPKWSARPRQLRTVNPAHGDDQGSAAERLRLLPEMRAAGERRSTTRNELEPSSSGSRLAAMRGDNSLPENNPDGFRYGWRIRRFMERKIPRQNAYRHQLRPIHPRTATAARVSPPLEDGSRYSSPFSQNVYSRTRQLAAPLMRRQPGPWDEAYVTDGQAADTHPPMNGWGL